VRSAARRTQMPLNPPSSIACRSNSGTNWTTSLPLNPVTSNQEPFRSRERFQPPVPCHPPFRGPSQLWPPNLRSKTRTTSQSCPIAIR
jgi:hypothetical protein